VERVAQNDRDRNVVHLREAPLGAEEAFYHRIAKEHAPSRHHETIAAPSFSI
jgi:hypothetical protein